MKEYKAGEVFGELALLYNAPRAASIIALEDSILWSTDRETFNHLVKNAAINRRQNYLDLIQKVEILQEIDFEGRQKLMDAFTEVRFRANEHVIR